MSAGHRALDSRGGLLLSAYTGHASPVTASRERSHAVGADLVTGFRVDQRPSGGVARGRNSGIAATTRSRDVDRRFCTPRTKAASRALWRSLPSGAARRSGSPRSSRRAPRDRGRPLVAMGVVWPKSTSSGRRAPDHESTRPGFSGCCRFKLISATHVWRPLRAASRSGSPATAQRYASG